MIMDPDLMIFVQIRIPKSATSTRMGRQPGILSLGGFVRGESVRPL
jgi:hypothetical protein